jgi:lambda family phage portal protein
MFDWLKNLGAKRRATGITAHALRFIRAKFDSAQTTPDNRRHWANADLLSADASASPEVRRILRSRARYEVANNCYARGIILTLANDVIGTGPRLQMLLGDGADAGANQTIEREFARWARAVRLAEKLRTMRMARATDGEAFALLFSNGNLANPVKLDIRLIEADQVTTPGLMQQKAGAVDGIVFDEFGNPEEYHLLKAHPGSGAAALGADYERVPADSMVHWFRADRPGQSRGVPELAPSLPLFAQLRQYRQAVLDAARTAANIALFMKTNAPAGGEAAEVEPLATMDLEPNMAVFTPEGWEPAQIKAEQPTTTFSEFCTGVIAEAARPFSMPKNVALCDSSGYNYASGRLDHQTYFKSIRVEQSHLEDVVLDRILAAWLAEAVKVYGLAPLEDWPHQWFWDGREHVDPAKEANAQETRLANHTTTLAAEYARAGKDWETELRQRAKEVALMTELGLPMAKAVPQGSRQTQDENDDGDEQGQSEAA